MKLLVLSDSHGDHAAVAAAYDNAGDVDAVVHLGDGGDDIWIITGVATCPIHAVAGNCDHHSQLPRERVLTIAGLRFLICHGDRYGVKGGLARLQAYAVAHGYDVVLYGHTHLAADDHVDGVRLINPGALSHTSRKSYALVTVTGCDLDVQFVAVD